MHMFVSAMLTGSFMAVISVAQNVGPYQDLCDALLGQSCASNPNGGSNLQYCCETELSSYVSCELNIWKSKVCPDENECVPNGLYIACEVHISLYLPITLSGAGWIDRFPFIVKVVSRRLGSSRLQHSGRLCAGAKR